MIQGKLLRVGMIALGLLGVFHPIAFASADAVGSDLVLRIPEPGTLTLIASGAAVLGGINWLRRRKK